MGDDYITLEKLDAYRLAKENSTLAWLIYKRFTWQEKKVIGDQFIRSIDSGGANIAEGYGRFHYLDKNKFYYNARGSLFEVKHWICLLKKRDLITTNELNTLSETNNLVLIKLNGLINAQNKRKVNDKK
jgi:four helix bundle protein